MIYEPRTFKGILRNSLESQQYSMEYWISSQGGNQCVITKRKYGTEAPVFPSSKGELSRG